MRVDRLHSAHKENTKAKHTARWHSTKSTDTQERDRQAALRCGLKDLCKEWSAGVQLGRKLHLVLTERLQAKSYTGSFRAKAEGQFNTINQIRMCKIIFTNELKIEMKASPLNRQVTPSFKKRQN